ncbi:MAG: carboxypeptidase regulatory-like domain-containing protein [Lewinellaceae bacterium]|nr:carboxypeptidase regulatory-like domain-containing protein [Lewinellaceae bacterium]
MRTLRNILLVLMLVLAGTMVSYAQTYRTLLRKADQLYELKAYTQAVEAYKEAFQKRSDEAEPLGKMADSYRHLNMMEEAADYYARALGNRRPPAVLYLQFGHVLKALGRYDEAKVNYLQYAASDPRVGNHYAQSCDYAKGQALTTMDYSVSNERINSPAADFGPAFYRDQVVFASSRTDVQRANYNWDGIAKTQLFVSRPGVDGYLQPPIFLRPTAASTGEGPASFSADGRYVAYTRNNFTAGTRQIPSSGMELSIFLSEIGTNGDFMRETPFPHNDTRGRTGYPCFTPDGNAIFFASDRDGGFGGYDLYISYREGASWSRPINLGPVVNSSGDEISPYFDGTNLYFASDWHEGFGGFDVFIAEQQDGRWAKVSNLGQPVNSAYDDYSYLFDNARGLGYVISNRKGGRGAEDIYKVAKAGDNVTLRVINSSDGSPVPNAIIDLSACQPGRNYVVTTDARGVFSFPLDRGMNCQIIVNKDGFNLARVDLSGMTLQGARELEIPMTRRGEEYYGKVIDNATNIPVANASVSVRNLITGSTFRVMTDRNGDFTLGLAPNGTYMLTYSAQGYREVNRNINTLDGRDRTILGTVPMYYADGPQPPNPNPNPNPNPGTITQGFAIQVAALTKDPTPDQFSDLWSIGNVYLKREGGVIKVRLGVYATRDEAVRLLGSVKKMKNFAGAFVVAEDNGPGASTSTGGGDPAPTPPPPPVTTGGGSYKIQLAAYKDPRWFDGSKVASLGTIQDYPKGAFTAKVLGSFATEADARRALAEVKRSGFPGAFVVQEVNGQLVTVK